MWMATVIRRALRCGLGNMYVLTLGGGLRARAVVLHDHCLARSRDIVLAFSWPQNAEWFGDDTAYMYDDQYGTGASSRVISVRIDNSSKVANITWEYRIPYEYPYGYSPIFGEADRLPTGNVLSQFWPSSQAAGIIEFDQRIFEVVPATNDLAWSIDIFSHPHDASFTDGRNKSTGGFGNTQGWLSYSSERFYDAPLVWKVLHFKDFISFATVNSLKQNHIRTGKYRLLDASNNTIVRGTFKFVPHWRMSSVRISLEHGGSDTPAAVEVSNEWGQVRRKWIPPLADAETGEYSYSYSYIDPI